MFKQWDDFVVFRWGVGFLLGLLKCLSGSFSRSRTLFKMVLSSPDSFWLEDLCWRFEVRSFLSFLNAMELLADGLLLLTFRKLSFTSILECVGCGGNY